MQKKSKRLEGEEEEEEGAPRDEYYNGNNVVSICPRFLLWYKIGKQ